MGGEDFEAVLAEARAQIMRGSDRGGGGLLPGRVWEYRFYGKIPLEAWFLLWKRLPALSVLVPVILVNQLPIAGQMMMKCIE